MRRLAFMSRMAFAAGYVALGWIIGWLLLPVLLVRVLLFAVRLGRALAPATTCPDGHRVPQYGRYACTVCRFEGFAWSWRCRWCGVSYGHARCPTCGQSVGNPLVR